MRRFLATFQLSQPAVRQSSAGSAPGGEPASRRAWPGSMRSNGVPAARRRSSPSGRHPDAFRTLAHVLAEEAEAATEVVRFRSARVPGPPHSRQD